jgi:hypothetical protein
VRSTFVPMHKYLFPNAYVLLMNGIFLFRTVTSHSILMSVSLPGFRRAQATVIFEYATLYCWCHQSQNIRTFTGTPTRFCRSSTQHSTHPAPGTGSQRVSISSLYSMKQLLLFSCTRFSRPTLWLILLDTTLLKHALFPTVQD